MYELFAGTGSNIEIGKTDYIEWDWDVLLARMGNLYLLETWVSCIKTCILSEIADALVHHQETSFTSRKRILRRQDASAISHCRSETALQEHVRVLLSSYWGGLTSNEN